MSDYKETCAGYVEDEDVVTFCSSEKKWITKINKLKDQYPEDVNIIYTAEDNHGMIYAQMPKSWLRISPPRQVNYTDEQRAAMAERLAAARKERDK